MDIQHYRYVVQKNHPQHYNKTQRGVFSLKHSKLVSLIGPLSTNGIAEDAILEDYFNTDAQQNDLALILLGLFVP